MKPSEGHKGKGSRDPKKHLGSGGLDKPIPRKQDSPTTFCKHCKKHRAASTIHITKECRKCEEDGTFKRSGKPLSSNTLSKASFAQAISNLTAKVQKLEKESKTKRSCSKKCCYASDSGCGGDSE